MKLVSVIIPIKRDENIAVLSYLITHDSTYKNCELIVVDKGLERSAQRNIGILQAKGEYLLILDSDQYPAVTLIEECVKLMENSDYDGIYLPERIMTLGRFGRLRNWERQFYTGTAIDVVRFVKAKNCPYFDETMSGPEDTDWDRQIGPKRTICKSLIYHRDEVDFKTYCEKKAYYTKSMGRFIKKNPHDKILNLRYRCWTVFTENGKWKLLLKSPLMALGLIFLLALRGIIYYTNR